MAKKNHGVDLLFGFFKGAAKVAGAAEREFKRQQRKKRVDELAANNLIRVITESIDIIKRSKNIKTMESRLHIARENLEKLKANHPRIEKNDIENELLSLEKLFPTERYLRRARELVVRASNAKTEKTRGKNLKAAEETIREGLTDSAADHEMLQRFDIKNELAAANKGEAEKSAVQKLNNYKKHQIEKYDWISAVDSCDTCRQHEEAGPYSVDDGLNGDAPIPGRNSHDKCRCTIAAVPE